MSSAKILIVDDELIMRESLAGWLQRDGHTVDTAPSGEEALEKLKEARFDIMLVDIKMEGISGLDVLQHVNENDPDVAIVMITAYGSIPTAIEAMKNGAYDYMLKPFDPNELGVLVDKIIKHQDQEREMLFLREEHKERTRFESMIGQSKPMQGVFDLICDVAPMESTVLITGETGTGKGLFRPFSVKPSFPGESWPKYRFSLLILPPLMLMPLLMPPTVPYWEAEVLTGPFTGLQALLYLMNV